jgi:hypothetical protein
MIKIKIRIKIKIKIKIRIPGLSSLSVTVHPLDKAEAQMALGVCRPSDRV